MRFALLFVFSLLSTTVHAQDFFVEQSSPAHGAANVNLTDTVAFAFNKRVDVQTDWNTSFLYEPEDALQSNNVSLCINFDGPCAGGDDDPRFVRYQVNHETDTDYTWLVYAVESDDGQAMAEPYVLRYTTAPTIGQRTVAGAINAPKRGAAVAPHQVQLTLRMLARGIARNRRGRPVFDRVAEAPVQRTNAVGAGAQPRTAFGTLGKAVRVDGPFTQVLLIDEFSVDESNWDIRAASVLVGSAGNYSVEFVREGTYVPVAVRYTDGATAEIDALGFYDANKDGAPDAVAVTDNDRSDIDLQLFEFPRTTAQAPNNLAVARDSAARYASDQTLKLIEAGAGLERAGTAYAWTYRFYSAGRDLETRVVVDPLRVAVDTTEGAPDFLTAMRSIPDDFVDSDNALRAVMQDGGQAFAASFRPGTLTILLEGGNQYWTDSPQPGEEFWRVRMVGVTPEGAEIFERYVDMGTGRILEVPDTQAPTRPEDFALDARDAEVVLAWAANPEDDLAGYRLYRTTTSTAGQPPEPADRLTMLQAGTTTYTDTEVDNRQPYYYRLTAVDEAGNESVATRERWAFPLPSAVAVDFSVAFGNPENASSYRLVALPGREPIALASTFDGAPGQEWMAYWDDGSPGDALVRYDGTSAFNFRPGRGFWAIGRSDWSPSRTVPMVDVRDDGTYAVDLHDGWNIISNPLDVDVNWQAVQTANEVTQTLWRWDGRFSAGTTFASAKTGQAYYFLNEQNMDALRIPYPGAPNQSADAPSTTEALATLALHAVRSGRRVARVQAGTAPEGAEGRDAYDQFAPPGYFEAASLRFVNTAVDPTYADLAAEYRPAGRAGYTFDVRLTATPGQSIQLQADGLAAFADRRVLLVHPASAQVYDLHARPTVTLRPEAKTTQLKLLLGDPAYIDRKVSTGAPNVLQLLPNYPNPFQDQTTLEYTLPEQHAVELVIYDVLGRRVRTLVQKRQRPGAYRVRWDGRNEAGQAVSSGIYLGRLRVEGRTRVQQLVLVR